MTKVSNPKGFSAVEGLLVVVTIGLVAGVGLWVHSRVTNNAKPVNVEYSQQLDASKNGTISGVEQVNSYDEKDEQKAEDELTAQEQNSAQADMQAISETGDGYEVDL